MDEQPIGLDARETRIGPFEILWQHSVFVEERWFSGRRVKGRKVDPTQPDGRANEKVCIKQISSISTAEERESLKTEYETLSKLDTPQVPKPLGYFEGTRALVTSFFDGRRLSDLFQDKGAHQAVVEPATALDIVVECAQVVEQAHENGVLHGRLNPRCVLMETSGSLWLLGFGEQGDQEESWLAPECAREKPVTTKTDQWNLAALLLGLLLAEVPWKGLDPIGEASRGDLERNLEILQEELPSIARCLRKALESNPANRFSTLGLFTKELLKLKRNLTDPSRRQFLASQLQRVTTTETPDAETTRLQQKQVQPNLSEDAEVPRAMQRDEAEPALAGLPRATSNESADGPDVSFMLPAGKTAKEASDIEDPLLGGAFPTLVDEDDPTDAGFTSQTSPSSTSHDAFKETELEPAEELETQAAAQAKQAVSYNLGSLGIGDVALDNTASHKSALAGDPANLVAKVALASLGLVLVLVLLFQLKSCIL